jgi:hypothetical protein
MERFTTSATSSSGVRWVKVEQGELQRLNSIPWLKGAGSLLVLKKALFVLPNEWRAGEPMRPVRPTAHKLLSPSLYNDLPLCHPWID